jgi:hypothetical protein
MGTLCSDWADAGLLEKRENLSIHSISPTYVRHGNKRHITRPSDLSGTSRSSGSTLSFFITLTYIHTEFLTFTYIYTEGEKASRTETDTDLDTDTATERHYLSLSFTLKASIASALSKTGGAVLGAPSRGAGRAEGAWEGGLGTGVLHVGQRFHALLTARGRNSHKSVP